MARIKLTEQVSYEFNFQMQVRITDINIANHLGHVELIGMMHEARHQFFNMLGFSELRLGSDNVGIVIIDLATNYLREVFAGDFINIDILLDDLRDKSFRIYYRLMRGDEIIALAETGIAPFIYGEKKPVPVPQKFIESLQRFREQSVTARKEM
jgi:acyl-CoA thioesterase FadM